MTFLPLPPRRVTPEWRRHRRLSVAGNLCLALIGVAVVLGASASIVSKHDGLKLFETGQATKARVIGRDSVKSKNSASHYLSYQFTVEGRTYEARHGVAYVDWSAEGTLVDAVYDPADPSRSYLRCERRRMESVVGEGIGIAIGAIVVVVALLIFRSTSTTRWLWLNGVETTADLSWGQRPKYTWPWEGRTYHATSVRGPALKDGARVAIVIDPGRPGRMTPVTADMVPAERLEEATEPVERRLPPPPRTENFAWRKSVRPTAAFVIAGVLVAVAGIVALVVTPLFYARWSTRADSVKREGLILEKTATSVTYEVDRRRATFGISRSEVADFPQGTTIPVYVMGERMESEYELSYRGPTAGFIAALLIASLGVYVGLAGLREYWKARSLWVHGIEVHAAVTADHTNKGQRHVKYRFVRGRLEGRGGRSFPALQTSPVEGGGEIETVVVLVDGEDGRRHRMVMRNET
jgi:hypothetical protein